jgi:hypothetical protein
MQFSETAGRKLMMEERNFLGVEQNVKQNCNGIPTTHNCIQYCCLVCPIG